MADPLSELLSSLAANLAPHLFGDPNLNQQISENHYAGAYKGLLEGRSLKEQGLDPKALEGIVGPHNAATLLGMEKTDAFANAAQVWKGEQAKRQAGAAIGQAAAQFLTAPAVDTTTSPGYDMETATNRGGQPMETSLYPRLSGPGISPAAELATASLTARTPNQADYARRFAALPGEQQQVVLGSEAQAAHEAQLQRLNVSEPNVETAKKNAITEAANAATSAGNLALSTRAQTFAEQQARIGNVQKKSQQRRAAILDSLKLVQTAHPTLSSVQQQKIARFHAGYTPQSTLGSLADLPGVVKGTNGLRADTTFNALNTAAARVPTFVKSIKNPKAAAQLDQNALEGENNAALTELTRAVVTHMQTMGGSITPESVLAEVKNRARFAQKSGSKIAAVGFDALDEPTRNAKLTIVGQALDAIGGGASGAGGAAGDYVQRTLGALPQGNPQGTAPAPYIAPPATAGIAVPRGTRLGSLAEQQAAASRAPGEAAARQQAEENARRRQQQEYAVPGPRIPFLSR